MPFVNTLPQLVAQAYKPLEQMTPQEIQQFLLKYPTPALSKNEEYWNSLARTPAGKEFLTAHSTNRRNAGATEEANTIDSALKAALNRPLITELPKLPPPAPSAHASYVAGASPTTTLGLLPTANQQIATNRIGTNSLQIPLLNRPTEIRLPMLPTRK